MTSELGEFGAQSALIAAGTGANRTLDLTILMSLGAALILVAVMALVWAAWRAERAPRAWWVWGGGVVFPVLVLLTLLVGSALTLRSIARPAPDALVIEVTGYQYWWDVVYDPGGLALRDANEVFVPVGVPVTLRLKTEDVIHSFWVPSIAGKMDMVPGRINEMVITATVPGRYRGQCAEFCGLAHPRMAIEMVALPPEDFAAWVRAFQTAGREPRTDAEARGREVFLSAGCAACHRIRSVAEGGRRGPDLTRVGARASLGAGMWRMNIGNLAGWIADVGDMKPGAKMPSYNHLSGPDLRAVAAYMESLQ